MCVFVCVCVCGVCESDVLAWKMFITLPEVGMTIQQYCGSTSLRAPNLVFISCLALEL